MWPQSLDQVLEELLRNLYRNWYSLPRRSTLPDLNRLRIQLADLFAASMAPVDVNALEAAMIDFAAAVHRLPGAAEAGGDALAELAGAVPTAQQSGYRSRVKTNTAPGRLEALADLLRLENPPQALIQRMNYALSQTPEIWRAVWEAVGPRLGEIPLEERTTIEATAERVDASIAASVATGSPSAFASKEVLTVYENGLKDLEKSAAVVRIAAPIFFANKYAGAPPVTYGTAKDILETYHAAQALPQMVESAAEPPPPGEEVRVPFFADVRFPTEVKRSEVQWLSVQLKMEASPDSRTQDVVAVGFEAAPPGQLPPPQFVEVRLVAPDFSEQTGIWERAITVYSNRDSQPAVFLLSSDKPGRKRITIDFYHKGRMLASTHFDSEVVTGATQRSGSAATLGESLEMGEFAANPPPPADLELRVARAVESNVLSFVINSSLPDVPLRSQPAGQIKLNSKDPQAFFSDRLQRLTDLARALPAAEVDQRLIREVESLGEGLFEQLLPPELQQIYWDQIKPLVDQGRIKSLLINSDEPWIPWELIKPYRWNDADDSEQSGPFLVEQFTLSRWLARPLPGGVDIKQATLVMPEVDLPYVQEERDYFTSLAQQHALQIQGPLQLRNDVIDCMRTGGFQLLHFATHGTYNAQDAERSELYLGDQNLTPADLAGGDLRGLRAARPLVFLNACDSGKAGLDLTGIGGWAHKFFADGRATAFIGTLWEVSDDLAADFSCSFYRGLEEGKTLGEALRAARLQIRAQEPGNPTWLAYALYGDPNARITFGA